MANREFFLISTIKDPKNVLFSYFLHKSLRKNLSKTFAPKLGIVFKYGCLINVEWEQGTNMSSVKSWV